MSVMSLERWQIIRLAYNVYELLYDSDKKKWEIKDVVCYFWVHRFWQIETKFFWLCMLPDSTCLLMLWVFAYPSDPRPHLDIVLGVPWWCETGSRRKNDTYFCLKLDNCFGNHFNKRWKKSKLYWSLRSVTAPKEKSSWKLLWLRKKQNWEWRRPN